MHMQVGGPRARRRVVAGEVAPPGHAVLAAPTITQPRQHRPRRVDLRQGSDLAEQVDDRLGAEARHGGRSDMMQGEEDPGRGGLQVRDQRRRPVDPLRGVKRERDGSGHAP